MDETYTLPLALLDFVPNIAFLIGAYFLVRLARRMRGTGCARLLMAGTLLVFLGGALKATWKLLYTTGAADLQLLGEIQFVLLAPGFLAMVIAVIILARRQRAAGMPLAAIATWKIPLMAVMVVCSLGADGILTYLAFRRGARLAGALFIVAFLGTLAMGGMSSGTQTVARQWIEESVNSLGQMAFAGGTYLLDRHVSTHPEAPCG